MDKTYREGVRVATAFEGGLKLAAQPQNGVDNHAKRSLGGNVRKVKQLVKSIVRVFYRLLKPLFRPVVSRILRDLSGNMKLVVHQEFQSVHQEIQRLTVENQKLAAMVSTKGRIAISCGDGAILIKTEAGWVLCDANDYALIAYLMDVGELEVGTRLLIEKFLKPGDCFVDVGANIGMHTLAAARALKGQGKVVAFEPFGRTKQLLEQSVWMNGFSSLVDVYEAAISNEPGIKPLFLGKTCGHHSLFPLDGGQDTEKEKVEVKLLRLDDVISVAQRVDLLKIDAEGAELNVIESATSTIKRNDDIAIIVEFGPSHLQRIGIEPHQWFSVFEKLELEWKVINNDTGLLEKKDLAELISGYSVNLLFAKKGSKAWRRLAG
jgi:FkbM family methyltransferase